MKPAPPERWRGRPALRRTTTSVSERVKESPRPLAISLCGRIRPEDLEEQRAVPDPCEHVLDGGRVAMALEVDEHDVLPRLLLPRPRLDLRQVEAVRGERLQDPEQRARLV